jgi:hypothetical protein
MVLTRVSWGVVGSGSGRDRRNRAMTDIGPILGYHADPG